MLRRLGVDDQIDYTTISKYELDKNEPPLDILLKYARVAGVHMEDIVDDELDLPTKLPGNVRYRGLKRKPTSRKQRH
jgi:transcriptional regulator with XRE-family HTH domain